MMIGPCPLIAVFLLLLNIAQAFHSSALAKNPSRVILSSLLDDSASSFQDVFEKGTSALLSDDLPSVDLKSLELPSIQLPSLDGVDPVIAAAAVGLGVASIALATSSKGETKTGGGTATVKKPRQTKQVKPAPLAIPYDAAARLAYDEWRKENDAKFKQDAYEAFKEIFEAKAVAEATSRKLARDLTAFKNEAPPPPPQRKITPRPTPKTIEEAPSKPFFAMES